MPDPRKRQLIEWIRPYLSGSQFKVSPDEFRFHQHEPGKLLDYKKHHAAGQLSNLMKDLLVWEERKDETPFPAQVYTTRVFIIPEPVMKEIVLQLFGEE